MLRARDALVSVGTELINTTRGLVKSMGTRLPPCSSPSFAEKVKDAIPVEVREALLPLVQLVETVNDCIARYDEKIEELGRNKYGHTTLLRQVKGVGPITSLAYVLTLEDPQRFASSREVGPYLGLVPKQEDSGDSQPQLGISKAGDRMLRRLLVGVRNTCWEPSDRTPTYGGTGCDCVNAEERMRRSEPWWRWHESWPSCCITCG